MIGETGDRMQRGWSMIELLIAMSIMLAVLTLVGTALLTGRKASRSTSIAIKMDEDLRTILGRISEELRVASRVGEDTNGNDILDAGEDTNGNGRLDADWNLTPTSVTFNRRLPDLSYSLPITFRLTDDKIEHVVQTDPGGASITTAIARRVTEFDISEGTSMVTITLGITVPVSAEDNISRSQSVNVTPRN